MESDKEQQLLAHYIITRIILADEPTASLDTERAHQVVDLLARIAHEYNRGVVMITHDMRLLDKVDQVYTMQDGKLSRGNALQYN